MVQFRCRNMRSPNNTAATKNGVAKAMAPTITGAGGVTASYGSKAACTAQRVVRETLA